jgi:non-canonical purine NTP pyrophosphatase (RdgB/HAM1 family)
MSTVIFVTGNPEKARHFSQHIGYDIAHRRAELDEIQTLKTDELVEHKARQAYQQLQQPVLVEDVSFVCEALGSLPGPFVKFFVEEKNGVENICRMMDGFASRRARAQCVFGYFDGNKIRFFEGYTDGAIAQHPRGENGYGFDRIFEPDGFSGKTAGQLRDEDYDRYYMTIKPFEKVKEFLVNHGLV